MRRIRAEYVFGVESIWLSKDLLGQRYPFRHREYDAVVELPDAPDAFGLFEQSAFGGFLLPSSYWSGKSRGDAVKPEDSRTHDVTSISAVRMSLTKSVDLCA